MNALNIFELYLYPNLKILSLSQRCHNMLHFGVCFDSYLYAYVVSTIVACLMDVITVQCMIPGPWNWKILKGIQSSLKVFITDVLFLL